MKYLNLLLISFILLSCSTDSGKDVSDPQPADAEKIKSVIFDNDSIHFTVVSSVPNPCYGFDSSMIDRSNEVVSITIYAHKLAINPCPTVLSSIESEVTVPAKSGNTYLFKFWKYGEATLDTIITIP